MDSFLLRRMSYNNIFILGCKANFEKFRENSPIKVLDLTEDDDAEITLPVVRRDKVKSFSIISIKFYHNGSEITTTFLRKEEKPEKEDGKWIASIQVNFLLLIIFKISFYVPLLNTSLSLIQFRSLMRLL